MDAYCAWPELSLRPVREDDLDLEVERTKEEINRVKSNTLQSLQNSLRIADHTQTLGNDVIDRLGDQTKSLHDVDKCLHTSLNKSRKAVSKAAHLGVLNRGLLRWHKNNSKSEEAYEVESCDIQTKIREQKQASAYASQMRHIKNQSIRNRDFENSGEQAVLADAQHNIRPDERYNFEADDEEIAVEWSINDHM